VSMHPSSDDSPLPFAMLWDDKDIRSHALMTDEVHRHGSLAGIELWHGGACTLNRTSRIAPLSPSGMPWLSTHIGFMGNLRPRRMDAADIRDLLKWQAEGAQRPPCTGGEHAALSVVGHHLAAGVDAEPAEGGGDVTDLR